MSVVGSKLRYGLVTLLCGVVAVGAGCGGSGDESASTSSQGSQSESPVKVSMAINPWIGVGPWSIAKKKGFDKENGIDLSLESFKTDNDREQAFAAGQLDASNVPLHAIAKLLSAGTTPFKTVMFLDASYTADAMIGPKSVQSIDQLRGQKVAYEEGTTSDLLLRYGLKEAGLSFDDIELVPMPASDAGSALVAGRVKVAVTYEPYIAAAMNANPDLHIIYAGEAAPGLISDVLIVTEEFAEQNPDAVTNLVKTWNQAVEFLRSNPDEGEKIIADASGAPVEDLKSSFDGVKIMNEQESLTFMQEEIPPLLKTVDEILIEQGALSGKTVDAAKTIDLSYLETATGG